MLYTARQNHGYRVEWKDPEFSGIACTYADVVYTNGDNVYYCKKNYKGWKGPAVELEKDGNLCWYAMKVLTIMSVDDGSR